MQKKTAFTENSNDYCRTMLLTALTIFGAALIDPIWKINHLYSMELFPTVIRNMATAFCNLGGRIGSIIGPLIVYLSKIFFPLPFIVFGIFSLFHVLICFFLLPETKNHLMPDSFHDSILDSDSKELQILNSNESKNIDNDNSPND